MSSALFSSSDTLASRYAAVNSSSCSPSYFVDLGLPNIHVLQVSAQPLQNYTYTPPPGTNLADNAPVPNLNFCNLTISYTHPGWNDTINTNIFLPTNNWNGRYQANGGSGFVTGGSSTLASSIMATLGQGYVISTTDGGHTSDSVILASLMSPWALSSPGNVNWPLLIDFASESLYEMALLSKAAIQTVYQQPPAYSYWQGHSTGGRQGYTFAQRYPDVFDGILALFPAINWIELMAELAWPLFIMDQEGNYPNPCEINAITVAAIEACDGLDGVQDGLISQPGLCDFDAHSVVGKAINCGGSPANISEDAATVAQATWDGPRSSTGDFQWYGYLRGANISEAGYPAGTTCNAAGFCEPAPFNLSQVWYNYWVQKNASATIRNITHEKWDDLLFADKQQYESAIGTTSPDLSRFKSAGGKMLTFHGFVDLLISSNGTVHYYESVEALDPQVQDYYRLFLAPGIGHSITGPITVPNVFDYLVDWVENGNAPETLRSQGVDPKGHVLDRDLCLYPKVQHYIGGNSTTPQAFQCI